MHADDLGITGRISLLVVDVAMPQTSGRELTDALTGVRPDVMVLLVSGYTENSVLHRGVSEDVNFLPK